jgi:hypothetical protein
MSTQLDSLLDIAAGISRGEIPPYQHNECFTSGAFDLLVVKLREGEAFQLLREACSRYQTLKDCGVGLEGFYLLLSLLARQSNTTEMPHGMAVVIKEQPALSADLREWYRHEG